MSNISTNVRLRPVRYAFLVRPDDAEQTLEIFRVNTCLWGGKFNPIIPCFKRIPKWWDRHNHKFETAAQITNGYLDFFEPDFLVEAEQGLSEGFGVNGKRIISLSEVLSREEESGGKGHGLNVLDLYRDLYRKEFQFARRHEHDIVDVSPIKPNFSAFTACLFGAFPTDTNLKYLGKAFIAAFAPKSTVLDGSNLAAIYRSGFTSALHIGHSHIEVDYHDQLSGPALFVLNAYEPRDLIDYWNLRAVRPNVLPVPVQWIQELSSFCKEFIIKNFRPMPGNPNGVMIRANVMFSRSIPSADIDQLHADYFRVDVDGANVRQDWYPSLWRPSPEFTVRQMRPTLSAATKTFDLPVIAEEPVVRFDCLHPKFAPEYGSEYRWANVVRLTDWTQNQVATTFPCDHRSPRFPKFAGGGRTILPTTEGLVIFPRYRNIPERWVLKDGSSAIADWLKINGIETRLSDAGRATQQVVQTLGGFWGLSSLAHPDIVRLLNEISRRPGSRSIHHHELKNRIRSSTKDDIWRDGSFEKLVQQNAVELGLELRCTKCSSWSWYSLKQLDYQLTCSLCLRQFPFPTISPGSEKNSKWAYRLIGPFALPNYANGAYAASLSIRFFSQIIGRAHDADVTWSAGQELQLAPQERVEADFILWHQRKVSFGNDYPTELIFGEAKSFRGASSEERRSHGDAFEAEDVDRMKKLSLRFPGSILVFSTMKRGDELSPDEVARIRKLAEWGREYMTDRRRTRAPVIILTGAELFAAHSLDAAWQAMGGRHAKLIEPGWITPDDPVVLADLTQQLYLNMPSYGEWSEARWKKRAERRNAK